MPALTRLVDRARAARVADDDARAYVAQLGRWARVEPEPRHAWPWWLGAGIALAAAAVVALLVMRTDRAPVVAPPGPELTVSTVQIGARVAMVADPGTRWRVVEVDADHTEILVESGTITARLFPGHTAHRLALRGANVAALAKGTVYSLTVDNGAGSVEVHEGIVEVVRDERTDSVRAGDRWPSTSLPRPRSAAAALLALEPPTPAAPPEPPVEAPSDRPIGKRAPRPMPDDAASSVRSLIDRWRQVRLLRGQGDFDAAIKESLAIADARDSTWSPIALMEAARIELGPRAAPERAILLANRFLAEWATHELASEARELRCRGLRQLGREAECAQTP